MWSPREIFSRLPRASRDTNDYRIFGVNAEYEHRSSRGKRNNLNGRMSVERQSHFLSPVRGYDSKHDPLLRFRDICPLRVFERSDAAKSANLNGTFERLVHRLIFLRSGILDYLTLILQDNSSNNMFTCFLIIIKLLIHINNDNLHCFT